ncbi:MAG: hypothetical protein KC414_12785 [Romboutsia sp.]|nr:hypothetical protein [Romboutsia sp.]
MEKVGKVKTIVKAFTEKSDINDEILEFRRSICGGCEFNSENVDTKKMSFIEQARKKVLNGEPFCTACGCQINEKTSRGTEECGLAEKGLVPKWNRVKLETVSKIEVDIINNSYKQVNIDLSVDKKSFVIQYGEIESNKIEEIELLIKAKEGKHLEMKYFTPSCGACTSSSYIKIDKNTYKVKLELNTAKLNDVFSKNVYFAYNIGTQYRKNRIQLKGKIK